MMDCHLGLNMEPNDPPVEVASSDGGRFLGVVQQYSAENGSGSIKLDVGEDEFFVESAQISLSDKYPKLTEGMKVEFTKGIIEGKLSALRVTLPGGRKFEERTLSQFYATGVVHSFTPTGHGLIKTLVDLPWPREISAGAMVHVMCDDVIYAEGSPRVLIEGAEVQFRIFESGTGLAATDVTAIGGAPITIDQPHAMDAKCNVTPLRDSPSANDHSLGGVPIAMKVMSSKGNNSFQINLKGMGVSKGKGKTKGKSPMQIVMMQTFLESVRSGLMPLRKTVDENGRPDYKLALSKSSLNSSFGPASNISGKFRGGSVNLSSAGGPGSKGRLAMLMSKSSPCRFFAKGACKAGANCAYSHEEATTLPTPTSTAPVGLVMRLAMNRAKK